LIARRRWCREPCAGAGGGRGAAGGGAGRSAAWAASGGRRVASRVVLAPWRLATPFVERRAPLWRRRRSDRGMPSYSPPFPSCCGCCWVCLYSDLIMILLIPSFCSSYRVYMCTPMSYAGSAPDWNTDEEQKHCITFF
jgi:hypothetical protein